MCVPAACHRMRALTRPQARHVSDHARPPRRRGLRDVQRVRACAAPRAQAGGRGRLRACRRHRGRPGRVPGCVRLSSSLSFSSLFTRVWTNSDTQRRGVDSGPPQAENGAPEDGRRDQRRRDERRGGERGRGRASQGPQVGHGHGRQRLDSLHVKFERRHAGEGSVYSYGLHS
jgi:hypothetical protein